MSNIASRFDSISDTSRWDNEGGHDVLQRQPWEETVPMTPAELVAELNR